VCDATHRTTRCSFSAADAAAGHGEFAISVADAFQRTGLGLPMMTAMERRASNLGHEMIAAETARANAEMRGLGSPRKTAGALAVSALICRMARIVL